MAKRKAHNRLTHEQASVVMVESGLTPLEPYPGNQTPWRSLCRCGVEYSPRRNNVVQGKNMCRSCAAQTKNRHSQLAENPEQRMLDHGLRPLEPYRGGHVPWRCECVTCGAITYPHRSNVTGCFECGAKRGGALLRTDEATAVAIMETAGFTPLEAYVNTSTPWRSRHECGLVSYPRLSNVKWGGSGCRFCRTYASMDMSAPSFLYVMASDALMSIKVGIGNVGSGRIEEHVRYGWCLAAKRGFATGGEAAKCERFILDSLGYWPHGYLLPEQMPQSGWTETAPIDSLDDALALIRSS